MCIRINMDAHGENPLSLRASSQPAFTKGEPFGYSATRNPIARPMSGRRTNSTRDPINTREICEREVNSIARWVQRHAAASRPAGGSPAHPSSRKRDATFPKVGRKVYSATRNSIARAMRARKTKPDKDPTTTR